MGDGQLFLMLRLNTGLSWSFALWCADPSRLLVWSTK